MKRLGRVVGAVLAVMLTMFSLQAQAETPLAGRDFNHNATGFPLTGIHALAACETCHAAGVFKGTPKNCDGCHSLGKRVVATPKSNGHIVTDAPCESCHFNASTFLGARFNHGTAVPGQCRICHNGRQSVGKPASHSSGNKALNSCDQCHRSYTWFQASWNHVGVAPGTCTNMGCHVAGSNQYYRGSGSHNHTGYQLTDSACDDCHNFVTWIPAPYKHNTGAPCSSCHNGSVATGKGSTHGSTTAECNTCHRNTISWLGASYHNGAVAGICGNCHNGTNGVKGTVNDPNGLHIPLTVGNPNCDLCHTSTTTFTAFTMNHSGLSTCNACHSTTSAYVVTTKRQLGNHQGSTAAQDCSNCHTSTGWAGALGSIPSNHIPYNATSTCSNCHSGASVATGDILHTYVSAVCKTCHNSSPVYLGSMTRKTIGSHEGSKTIQDCISSGCHARQFTRWNKP